MEIRDRIKELRRVKASEPQIRVVLESIRDILEDAATVEFDAVERCLEPDGSKFVTIKITIRSKEP